MYFSTILTIALLCFKCYESKLAKHQNDEDGGERWPNAQIPFLIDSNFTTKLLDEFNAAISDFHQFTCVRFREKTPYDKFFLHIYNGDDGCWSYVGMRQNFAINGQPLSLGLECDKKGVVLHELMHAIGFFHEHTRYDRDDYIVLNAQNIDQNHIKQFNKRSQHPVDLTGPYDLNSVLHYEENAFSIDPTIPTIIARSVNPAEVLKMGQRESLSPGDIQKINRYYNCSSIKTQIIEVKKAVETGMTRSLGSNKMEMHSLKKTKESHPKSFYWYKSASDFQIRTGKQAPTWLKYASFNDAAHEYPRAIQCQTLEESNCQDRSNNCLELALRNECERKPGYMLKMCRRSCCNCGDQKCFDTNDVAKYRTLCLGRFRNQTTNMETTACQLETTRQNALDYCPKSCFSCFSKQNNANVNT